jgi:hypothetical protein
VKRHDAPATDTAASGIQRTPQGILGTVSGVRVETSAARRGTIVSDVVLVGTVALLLGAALAARLDGSAAIVGFWISSVLVIVLGIALRLWFGLPYVEFNDAGVTAQQGYWKRQVPWSDVVALADVEFRTKGARWVWKLCIDLRSRRLECAGSTTTSRSERTAIVESIQPFLAAHGFGPLAAALPEANGNAKRYPRR